MVTFLLVLICAALFLLFLTMMFSDNNDFGCLFAGGCITCMVVAIALYLSFADEPTALDVYRGKTELKITSVNGIPTDTVVVYKKNKN